jgi:hypothetical protein
MSDALRRPLPPSVFARLADAARYVITGVSPDTWFGPRQPLQPMAPPEVKGRQWDYPFGANLNYIPRADDGVSFGELRGLADALPRPTRVQVASNDATVRSDAAGPRAGLQVAQIGPEPPPPPPEAPGAARPVEGPAKEPVSSASPSSGTESGPADNPQGVYDTTDGGVEIWIDAWSKIC